jgi:hypothetical protein
MARAGLFALALLATPLVPVFAEVGPEPDGTAPSDPRDFSGVWMNDNSLDEQLKREGRKRLDPSEPMPERAPPPLTEAYLEVQAERREARAHWSEGAEVCDWPGMPKVMTYPYPFEILHTPGRITMIFEAESQVRRIFLDRSEHLPFEELDPSYNGDSIGRWEGDTLVVDTIGLNDRTELSGGIPHSDQLHIVERFHYIDGDTMQVEMVLTDPLAFTRPIELELIYSKRPDWRIREYSCLENNRDAPAADGSRAGGIVDN